MNRWLVLALIVLVAGPTVLLRRSTQDEAPEAEATLLRGDRPNPFFGLVVFGGFRPMFLEYLWSKADTLSREGRHWEVAETFESITRLDPDNSAAWFNQSYWLGYNLAQSEPRPADRWRLYRRALEHLAEGLRRHPDDARLHQLRFDFFYGRIARDPAMDRQCRRAFGRDALGQALDAAYDWRAAHPKDFLAWDSLRVAGEDAAERLLNRGRYADAAAALEELGRIGAEMSQLFPSDREAAHAARIHPVWSALVARFASAFGDDGRLADESALVRVESELLELWERSGTFLVDSEVERFDGEAIASIHSRIMGLCQLALMAESPGLALRHQGWLAKLARLSDGKLGPRMPYYTEAYVSLFAKVIELDSTWRETDPADTAARSEVRTRLESRLGALNRIFRERTGRDDPFVERYANARFAR